MTNDNNIERNDQHTLAVNRSRQRVDLALGESSLMLAVLGTDSFKLEDFPIVGDEADNLKLLPTILPGLAVIQRDAVWKPRSNPDNWHGPESTHPELALEMMRHLSDRYAIASMEFGTEEQVDRYSSLLSFAWIGARSKDNLDLMRKAVTYDLTLPLGIKNGLDGDFEHTLEQIEQLRKERGTDAGQIALIFRGGDNAQTPDEWERQYVEAFRATDGKLIVDSAHGGEMAHDPSRAFTKTQAGQEACLKHITDLAIGGIIPAGVMIESSDVVSTIDPNISFELGCVAIRELLKIKQRRIDRQAHQHNIHSLERERSPYFVPRAGL